MKELDIADKTLKKKWSTNLVKLECL